jgi:hypothetical protein
MMSFRACQWPQVYGQRVLSHVASCPYEAFWEVRESIQIPLHIS